MEIHTAKKTTEIEPGEQDKKEGNAEMKRNQTSPINLSIPSVEKNTSADTSPPRSFSST